MDEIPVPTLVGLAGLAGGAVLGFVGRRARFCTLAAFEDAFFSADYRRLRAWALAVAVAMALTSGFASAGILDLTQAGVLRPTLAVASWIVGGALFGFGMTQVGTCGFGALVRLGGGDLRAIVVVVVMGVVGYSVLGGLLAPVRLALFGPLTLPMGDAASLRLNDILGVGEWLGAVIAGLLALWALRQGGLWRERRLLWASLAFGGVIAGGWWATGALGQSDPFEPVRVEGFSFVYPLGHTLIALMTSPEYWLTFATGTTFGVVLGSAGCALAQREFRWEACDDAVELRRHLVGAAAMGAGGVLAFGCTVGQGMTAAAAMSVSAPIVVASLAVGAWLGLHMIVEGRIGGAVASLLRRG